MERTLARETFVLRIAAAPATPDDPEAHRLDDLYPLRGNTPTLFVRNNDETTDALIKIHESDDSVTWTEHASSLTVVAKGRAKLDFTSSAKYLRFTLDADVVGGVFCELAFYHFNPTQQAGV